MLEPSSLSAVWRHPPADPQAARKVEPWGRRAWRAGLPIVGGALVGFVFIAIYEHWGGAWLQTGLPVWAELLTLGAVTVVSLVAHELGHLLGGKCAGWRPFLFVAGPVRLLFGERTTLTWGRLGPGALGLAASLPPARAGALPPRAFALMLLGGPLANVLLLLAGLALAASDPGPLGRTVAAMLVLVNGVNAWVNLLPIKVAGHLSDGYQLRQVWRREPAVQERLAFLLLQAHALAGRRPRDWDADQVAVVSEAAHDPQARLMGPMMVLAVAWDAGRWAQADQALARYVTALHGADYAQVPGLVRRALLLPVVTYLAQVRGEAEAAQRWWRAAQAQPAGLVQAHDQLHAEAALAHASGEHAKAVALAQRAMQKLAASGLPRSALVFTQELLQSLLRAAEGASRPQAGRPRPGPPA